MSVEQAVPSILRPRAGPHCPHCGFCLVGLPGSGACPECGAGFDATTAHRLLEMPSAGACARHVLAPLVATLLVCAVGIGVAPPLAALMLPTGLAWFGWRLRNLSRVIGTRVLPPGLAAPAGTRLLLRVATLVGWMFLAASGMITGAIVLFLWNIFGR